MPSTPVQKELGRIAADYRRFLVLKGLTLCWIASSAIGLALLGANRLFGFAIPHSLPILGGLTLAAAIAISVRQGRTRVALREIARQVERDDPRLNSLLLAALEQEPDPATGQLNFLQVRVIREALEANRKAPWHQRFTQRLFWAQGWHFAVLGGFALVLSALVFLRPGPAAKNAARESMQITPGNAAIEKDSAVAIVAQLRRPASGPVSLVYLSAGGGEKRTPMARSLNDPLYGFTLPAVGENTEYFIEFDGVRSERFKLEVFEYPDLKRADAELGYPAYTGLKPGKIEDTRRVSAVEGTEVQYAFYLNKPVRTARLLGANQTELILTNTAPGASSYALAFPLTESGRYKLELVDDEGRTNKIAPDFVFVALPNQPPALKLLSPRGDQRVSALQEVRFEAEAHDDFGLSAYGISYSVPGKMTETVTLSEGSPTKAHEKRSFAWTLPLESLAAEPGELVSYYLWADDLGPDGKVRRSESDIYFAEVRPFEEIFRADQGGQNSSSQQQQQQQGQQNPATKLLELQKEIVTATWNLQRRGPPAKESARFKEDAGVIHQSQEGALQQAQDLKGELRDEKSKGLADTVVSAMKLAVKNLADAADASSPKTLPAALDSEQTAYQALLKLQAREYQVSRSRSNSRSQSQSAQNQRAQRQLDQLEFKEEENRYESESQAAPLQTPEQRETVQVLSRLKELARRQQDMSGRLKELQTALSEAKTQPERAELERQLKRLQEEQQEIVQDMDELRQRMAQPENQSRMAEASRQLDQTRQETREAARQLENQNVSQALSSSTRAQQELQKLSDEFRKSTSSQFSDQMREMRQQARDLEEKQQEVAQKMEEMKEGRQQRSLSAEGPRQEALEALARQRAGLTNLLQQMRQVSEQSEVAEPLLSRQLYDTLRRSSQANPEKTLELSSQLLERSFLPQAAEAQEKAGETIRQLAEGVERAASSVLGDEQESLRFARSELQDLANRAERELENLSGRGDTNRAGQAGNADRSSPLQTNGVATATGDSPTNGLASANGARENPGAVPAPGGAPRPGETGEPRPGSDGERQMASAGQPGQGTPQPGQPGQRGERGNQQGQQGQQGGGSQREGANGGRQNFFEQWAERGAEGGGNRGGAVEGPLTGADYLRWSDRLRDVEEILQDPGLRTDVARVREQARSLRAEFKRHAQMPQWDLVEGEVIQPLRILQSRVAEELARHASREAVVPVDRDPVPPKYADAVSRYYERLGKE